MPYRMFRVLLSGPTASLTGRSNTFHLSSIELYGYFFNMRG